MKGKVLESVDIKKLLDKGAEFANGLGMDINSILEPLRSAISITCELDPNQVRYAHLCLLEVVYFQVEKQLEELAEAIESNIGKIGVCRKNTGISSYLEEISFIGIEKTDASTNAA